MTLQDQVFIWWLAIPAAPRLVGTLSLLPGNRQCQFRYAPGWALPLSPGLPADERRTFTPLPGFEMPGVFEDAGPDRWGRLVIERLDRPQRLAPIDYLFMAGDARFGCLGVSSSDSAYLPVARAALPTLASLDDLHNAVLLVAAGEPVDARLRRLLSQSRTLGGARPKACIEVDGAEWLIKFPDPADSTDIGLIEHCSLALARRCGITRVAESRPVRLRRHHALLVRRFDRAGANRYHMISARTLIAESEGSAARFGYDSLADALRRFAPGKWVRQECKELFRRMVFNILIDNTDDHEKNHALGAHGESWVLAPFYDASPQLTNLGYQAMHVGRAGMTSSIENALSACERFALRLPEAKKVVADVRSGVRGWLPHFRDAGVSAQDLDALATSLERAR